MLRTGITQLTPLASNPRPLPLCDVDLWLVSNIPALRDTPWPLELDEGVAVHDVPYLSHPEVNCPLLGMRALRRAGLCLQIDFVRSTVSVWVPAPWPRRLAVTVRRCLSGFRTLPAPW